MPRKANKSHKRHRMRGGAGAADNAIAVYGGIGQQIAGVGNVIAQNNPFGAAASVVPVVPAAPAAAVVQLQKGGNALLMPPVHGGNALAAPIKMGGGAQAGGIALSELAVPAVLLYANHNLAPARRSSAKSKKRYSFKRGSTRSKRRFRRR